MTDTIDTLQLLLRKLEQRTTLNGEDRAALLALPFTVRAMAAGSYINEEGDPPDRCGVLLSGFAFRHKLTGDGKRQILALHIPGEAVDIQSLFLGVVDHNVQMLTAGKIASIPRHALQTLFRTRAGIAEAIAIKLLVEASVFREWIVNVGRRNARSRIAHLLCEFATRLQGQGLADEYGYELPMTQEQLADATGLTPVHVNRVLRTLEQDGLITRDSRRLSFPDWRRLRSVGDFNERYLHCAPPSAPSSLPRMAMRSIGED